jgi:hypothetical protein
METEKPSLKNCVKALIDLVLDSEGHGLVYREFCALEPGLRGISFESFSAEYVPAKLALGCVYWVGCCAHHRIEDKVLRNLYFKEVMKIFASPRSLENATRFSESLYASNADPEQSPVPGVWVHLFRKLGLEATIRAGEEGEGRLSAGFHFMMEVGEALKIVFETIFDDFYDATEGLLRKEGTL